ncbi:MAG: LytTR family DNA-binding domain-containing protein [Roseburia sp.]|nr:LytTR family DNA-binding domain-containing protein [Roseburia sp.]
MRIAICDDNEAIRELLADRAGKVCPSAEICVYASGKALLEAQAAPDILLLDIRMPEQDGMDTAKRLRERSRDTILIFVTALEEYVFEAFDVGAFHYLVKPFGEERFAQVLLRAMAQYREQSSRRQEERSLLVKSGSVHTRILLRDIVYAEVFNRKVMIHCTDREIEYYGKLSDLERELGEDFFRPHRAYLVHFQYVIKYDASAIYLEKGMALMAKKRYSEFVRRYLLYNQRMGGEPCT